MRPELKKLDKACCDIYERHFKERAPDAFWTEIDRAEDVLAERLKPRPLGLMEIRQACMAYSAAFKRACNAGEAHTAPGADAG
jgi:hypothetical protein